jgi:hypothetical protein
MSWTVSNPVVNSVGSYQATVSHSNGISFNVAYAGSGMDSDTDVASAFQALVGLVDADANFTLQNASRQKAGTDSYTP